MSDKICASSDCRGLKGPHLIMQYVTQEWKVGSRPLVRLTGLSLSKVVRHLKKGASGEGSNPVGRKALLCEEDDRALPKAVLDACSAFKPMTEKQIIAKVWLLFDRIYSSPPIINSSVCRHPGLRNARKSSFVTAGIACIPWLVCSLVPAPP